MDPQIAAPRTFPLDAVRSEFGKSFGVEMMRGPHSGVAAEVASGVTDEFHCLVEWLGARARRLHDEALSLPGDSEPETYAGLLARMKYLLATMREARADGLNSVATSRRGVSVASAQFLLHNAMDHFSIPHGDYCDL